MAAHERLNANTSIASPTLLQRLAAVLPKDSNFNIYHLSTPPTRTSAIYSPPPNCRPDRTYCESHFLTASIRASANNDVLGSKEVLIFAIEVLIYSTSYNSTFFVSKADSTGFLHHLGLRKGTPSPLKDISATFLQHLVVEHQRPSIRSVISLFARAQDQYLFPGSVEYSGKHVLDDRGLVRWWCRVLDPLIQESQMLSEAKSSDWESVKGFLTIPGLEHHETLSYVPRKVPNQSSWTIGHPLLEITRHPKDVPPRCLIPHYPDDPKARFLVELDEEITKGKDGGNGQWKSVKSIDQFWDMMAFRQECSAGRMVGFIWIVFTPKERPEALDSSMIDSQVSFTSTIDDRAGDESTLLTSYNGDSETISPLTSFAASSQAQPSNSPIKPFEDTVPLSQQSAQSSRPRTPKKKKLRGIVVAREPRIKTEQTRVKSEILECPESTPYYKWTPECRGQIIMDEADYKRVTELLLRLDFANLDLATSSSIRWINEVRSGASGDMAEAWGKTVTGTKEVVQPSVANGTGVNTLNMGLVRKKRKADSDVPEEPVLPATDVSTPKVNVLGAGMVRKKAKV